MKQYLHSESLAASKNVCHHSALFPSGPVQASVIRTRLSLAPQRLKGEPMSSPSHTRSRLRSVVGTVALIVLLLPSVLAQEATYFALQRPGQGSVAIDKQKQTAYITDLGRSGDGDKLLVDNAPLLDYLAKLKVRHLVFTCSHPHSDHAGGIRALFEKPRAFFTDSTLKTARFESIDVIDNGVTDSL